MNRYLTASVAAIVVLVTTIIGASIAQSSTSVASLANMQLAAVPEPHAARALTDLQFARWMLANNRDEKVTDPNEDRALRLTNEAIVDVGKLLQVEPASKGAAPSDIVRGRDDRLHAALRYLKAAYADLRPPEDENPPNAWRKLALNKTWDAMHWTQLALGVDLRADVGQCRSLRKALTDLTTTREDLNEAIGAFGSNRGDAYNDTLRIRNQTNSTIRDLGQSISRQCGPTS